MVVVVTGASRGIGAALAAQYRAQGHEVVGTSRSPEAETHLDVTRPDSHNALAASLEDRAVELLVCNAGVYLDKGHDLKNGYGVDLWAQTFATNVTGVFLSIQALLPNLERAEVPKIAIISSQMASSARAPGGSYIYRASKAAVLNLGRNLAVDLKPRGIAVGIYHPGWVRTDMGGGAADIGVEQAVQGLGARIDYLSLDTTGCYEAWDGQQLQF
ncbi:NADP-dependent 3-hydroxy acid dehydrogenase YdfG [Sulfitobacter brevis]|uniref:NADP-dependent 3-hydroxy acid dehydrogenase YdfG n=1 Tax=Sulfitobacter brevis TaxID=74348 RepID=A0A1I2AHI8_9RHOB|nr:SDR family oxidoreductase [Sulfitobacter brevis]SFE43342.1 NADP-dependent 3-hydroxy acid dehydrogenase YdfG [Sulfitobacter brevis]